MPKALPPDASKEIKPISAFTDKVLPPSPQAADVENVLKIEEVDSEHEGVEETKIQKQTKEQVPIELAVKG